MTRKLHLYWRTVRYLKFSQLTGRLRFKLTRVQPDLHPAPPLADLKEKEAFPAIPWTVWPGGTRFRFLNAEHEVTAAEDWNRQEWGKLWLYNLHYFDCLRQPALPEQAGKAWIARWIAENPPGAGNGWEPYPLSLRIVNWIKWHLAGHALSVEALDSLAVQIRYLAKRLERHLLANHYLANAKALVFAGCFFRGPEAADWLTAGCGIYREQLPEQILADGGHFERSPMYHSIILEDLLDLINIGAPLFSEDIVARMLKWLAAMTGPDGKIALLNDAAFDIAPPPQTLFDYARKLGFAPQEPVTGSIDLPDTGYTRLSDGVWTLICDGAPVGPDYQPGHAHADTLTFELWHRSFRLLIDSGTGEYIDTPLRREQRGTAGHNTVTVDGKNSTEVWSAHRVARRARIVERYFDGERLTAAHDGYTPVIHRREWQFQDGKVRVTDQLSGNGRHAIDLFWHLAPECTIVRRGAELTVTAGGRCFFITVPEGGILTTGTGRHSSEFGLAKDAPAIHWHGDMQLPFKAITEIGELG